MSLIIITGSSGFVPEGAQEYRESLRHPDRIGRIPFIFYKDKEGVYYVNRHLFTGFYNLAHKINYNLMFDGIDNMVDVFIETDPTIISTSLCGSLNESLSEGTMVFPTDFVCKKLSAPNFNRYFDMKNPFNRALIKKIVDSLPQDCINFSMNKTVATIEGPRFNTASESLALSDVADVVNMTTSHEAQIAKYRKIPYAQILYVSDMDTRFNTAEKKIEDIKSAGEVFNSILENIIPLINAKLQK